MHVSNIQQQDTETLQQLISMTLQTNLVAIDKVLAAARRASSTTYIAACARCDSVGERMKRVANEIKETLDAYELKEKLK